MERELHARAPSPAAGARARPRGAGRGPRRVRPGRAMHHRRVRAPGRPRRPAGEHRPPGQGHGRVRPGGGQRGRRCRPRRRWPCPGRRRSAARGPGARPAAGCAGSRRSMRPRSSRRAAARRRASPGWTPGCWPARLYSGAGSPGGTGWHYSAPVAPAQAATLVAAFNGGFQMKDARGGYFAEGRNPYPLVRGAASLVFYANGDVTVGTWGADVRQVTRRGRRPAEPRPAGLRRPAHGGGPRGLALLGQHLRRDLMRRVGAGGGAPVAIGRRRHRQRRAGVRPRPGPRPDPARLAARPRRGHPRHGAGHQPGVAGLRRLRAARRAGRATPVNGRKLLATMQGPGTFFERRWQRDFVTMSAR